MLTATMPSKKKSGKRSKRPPNPNAIFLTLDDETAAALVAFIDDQKVPPERTAVVLHALRRFLAAEGFLKPAPK
jgi:hypothetical protein